MASEAQSFPEVEPLKGTIAVSRKVSDGNYGGEEVYFAQQFYIDPTWDAEQRLAAARQAVSESRALVYEVHGLPMSLDGAGNVVDPATVVQNAFPGAQVVGTTAGSQVIEAASTETQAQPAGVPADPPFDPKSLPRKSRRQWSDDEKAKGDAIAQWAEARFGQNPDEFFDNRGDKASGKINAYSPDIKHKRTEAVAWFKS